MNPHQPSREQIEARITALLLGELPAAEAELLRWTMAQDAEMSKLHDRLKLTIGFVREAAKNPAAASAEINAPLKLSDERRKQLLAHFKTPRPKPSIWLRPIIQVPRLVTVLALVALVALVAAMLLPALSSAKKRAMNVSSLHGSRGTYSSGRFWSADNSERAETAVSVPVAAAPPANAPAVVTLAPEPALAPPPVQIVLPSTESPAQAATITGSLADSGKGGVISQSIADYGIIQNNSGAAATPPADLFAFQTSAGGQPVAFGNSQVLGVVNSFNGATDTRFGGGSGGGGGGAGGASTANGTALAWYDSGANRSRAENGPVNLGEELRRQTPTRAAGVNHGLVLPGAAAETQQEKLPDIALNTVAGESSVGRKLKEENSDQLLTGGLRGYYDDGVSAGNKFYRQPARGIEADKTPVLGDLPVAGSLFQNSTIASTVATPVATAPPVTSDENKTYSGAVTVSSGNLALGVAKDQDGATFQFAAANAVVMNGVAGNNTFNSGVVPRLNEEQLRITNRRQNDQEEATKNNPPYDYAKRELEQKLRMHELLYSKLEAERLDLALPKASPVQITDRAEPAKNQSTWQKLTGEFESKARIKVESDVNDIAGLNTKPTAGAYDPYFVQTTTETIQSDAVLGKVVDALKLDDAWTKKGGREKLTKKETISLLKKRLDLNPVKNTKLIEIGATSDQPEEAAKIANAVAEAYKDYRFASRRELTNGGLKTLQEQFAEQEKDIRQAQAEVDRLGKELNPEQADAAIRKPPTNAPIPQPEIQTRENAFSTFSLNVSDVSFKLAAASLEKGQLPDAASIRSEEFINAFDYRDPEAKWDSASSLSAQTGKMPVPQPVAFAAERARYPFAYNRNLLRFSVKTAAAGRQAGRALNLVLLLDTSGSMERADRVQIIREALRVLAAQLQPQDAVSVVTFARTARLWADGVPGDKAGETLSQVGGITPDGGTNLEEAMRLAYETARRHYLAGGMNRVVLLTDGAANLGNVDPGALKQKVEAQRRQGIALDCFGIGWEDFNDDLLEQLSGNGDGRYAFINSPEDAAKDFAAKLAGALQVAAQDVKVQVEFNPQRVISWRQIGYAKHQLTKEQFRDNSVIAAEIAAQEAGNALYTVETKPDGLGPIATVFVRYRVPGTQEVHERSWAVDYDGTAPALENSSPAMRLAATASAFSEWLAASPFAQEVTPDELLKDLSGVPEVYGADSRPMKLEWMIRQAKSVAGK